MVQILSITLGSRHKHRFCNKPLLLLFLGLSLFSLVCTQANSAIATDKGSAETIRLKVRNVSFPAEDPGGKGLSNFRRRRERYLNIALKEAALVLIDVWRTKNDRLGSNSHIEEVIHNHIAPVLKVARKANLLVLHAPHRAIGWDGISRQRPVDLRGPTETGRDKLPSWLASKKVSPTRWPPLKFVFRVGEYGEFARNSNPSYIPYTQVLGIHPAVRPKKRGREYIASSFEKVQRIFRENKILHLFYAGFGTNMCVMSRPVGIRNLSALGYNVIILRDATLGTELPDTLETQDVTKAAILDIEINYGFSASSTDFIRALEKVWH